MPADVSSQVTEGKSWLQDLATGLVQGLTTDLVGAPIDALQALADKVKESVKGKQYPFKEKDGAATGSSDWLKEVLGASTDRTAAKDLGALLSSFIDPATALKGLPLAIGAIRPFGARNLALVHNMPADERALEFLKSGKSLGNPSIAIADNPYPFNSTPTFIFNPDSKLLDPAGNPQNQLFNRDAYTDRAKSFLQKWGKDFRLGEINIGARTKDLRLTEGHNPGEDQKLAIWGSPRFKSFQDYESKISGAGALSKSDYLKESSDLNVDVIRYFRDNFDYDLTDISAKRKIKMLQKEAKQGDEEAISLLKRASEVGSDYAELKVVGQVPVNRNNINAILIPQASPFALDSKDVQAFMQEGKKLGIPTGTHANLASQEIKDKAEEAVQRMLAESRMYAKHLAPTDITNSILTGYGTSDVAIRSIPGLAKGLVAQNPSKIFITPENLLRRQVWNSPELLQELLAQLSTSSWQSR